MRESSEDRQSRDLLESLKLGKAIPDIEDVHQPNENPLLNAPWEVMPRDSFLCCHVVTAKPFCRFTSLGKDGKRRRHTQASKIPVVRCVPQDIAQHIVDNHNLYLRVREAERQVTVPAITKGDRSELKRSTRRLTDAAVIVVTWALTEAHRLNHDYIGSEHLLLALVKNPGRLTARLLMDSGVSERKVQVETMKHVKPGKPHTRSATPPMTSCAINAMEYAFNQASLQTADGVATEHILLGLLHDSASTAFKVLTALDPKSDNTQGNKVSVR